MSKKRKLNSKNPKYRPKVTEQVIKKEDKLICETKGVKVYATYYK
jgi:hypothetical protein